MGFATAVGFRRTKVQATVGTCFSLPHPKHPPKKLLYRMALDWFGGYPYFPGPSSHQLNNRFVAPLRLLYIKSDKKAQVFSSGFQSADENNRTAECLVEVTTNRDRPL